MAALKYSRQRVSIKDFLMTRADHPTADVVYQELRHTYPNISLGTVYRNLSLLADMGEIVKVTTGYGADHFDAHTAPHDHVVCTRCHKIQDLKMNYPENVEEIASMFYSGKIEGHTTNFYGICSECLARESED